MNLSAHVCRARLSWVKIGLLCFGLALAPCVIAQSLGTVVGQVSNAATATFLEVAEVAVAGSSRIAITDREGRYELSLPPGVATVVVTYTGLEVKRVPVVVSAGSRVVQNFELSSSVYRMGAFTVSGLREGSASAITKQREAFNVKNIVAADSFGNVAVGPVTVSGVSGRLGRKGAYTDTFPGLHLRYAPTRGFVSRLSYSSGIGRPSFEALMPADSVNEVAQTVSIRNTGLKPQYADNFDATAEYYFEPVGSLTASVFMKQIKGFQFTDSSQFVATGADNGFDGQYGGYRITTTRNGGNARYRGVEVADQQQFTFLPGFWRGFGCYANYTRLLTRGDYGGATVTTQVAGFVPKTGNVALTYLGAGFNLRLNAVWRSEYLVTNSTNAALVVYHEPKLQLNLKTRYNFSRATSIFCDIENFNKSPITETWVGSKDRPNQTRIVVAKVVAGIQGRC